MYYYVVCFKIAGLFVQRQLISGLSSPIDKVFTSHKVLCICASRGKKNGWAFVYRRFSPFLFSSRCSHLVLIADLNSLQILHPMQGSLERIELTLAQF